MPQMRQILVILALMSGPVHDVHAADPVAEMYLHQVKLVEDDVLSLARAMPAEKYSFAPTQGRLLECGPSASRSGISPP